MVKRIYIENYNWNEIQSFYENGLSFRDLQEMYKMSSKTLHKAKKLGLFKSRDYKESAKNTSLVKPRDYTEIRSRRSDLVNYRADCAFKFNLKDYPEEFDFTLIEKYGWYRPKNRGDNLNGISRDHAVSIKYGFDNALPSEHLSHPANCVLMQHGKNVSKYSSNSISYQDLLVRIKIWDNKYGAIAQMGER